MTQQHLVIIGTGMAGGRLLEELMRRDPQRYKVSVFGEEPHPNYNRIMLSPLLAGEVNADEIVLNSRDWYAEHHIDLYAGERIVAIDKINREVVSNTGTRLHYDHLVMATGSLPIRIPTAEEHLANIHAFRTLEDVDAINHGANAAKNAVVIGGGLLGLEAAYGLALKGIKTTVINRVDYLLNRQLDEAAGEMLRVTLLDKGVETALNAEISHFTGNESVTGVALASGEVIPADLVVIAIGITPNSSLAKATELSVNRGMIVDAMLQSSDPHISGIGECIELNGETFGMVAPIWDQARILADRLIFGINTPFQSKAIPTKLKVSGVDLFSAGEVLGHTDDRVMVLQDPAQLTYRKLIFRNHKIIGVVLFGDVQDGNWYFELLEQQADIQHLLPNLMFGRSFCQHLLKPDTTNQPDTALTGASL